MGGDQPSGQDTVNVTLHFRETHGFYGPIHVQHQLQLVSEVGLISPFD